MAQMVLGEPSSTKIVQIILVNLKHGCQRAEFVLLYIYRENFFLQTGIFKSALKLGARIQNNLDDFLQN